MRKFEFEYLNVFQHALDAAVLVDEVAASLPLGRAYLADQIRRASASLVLNIAEGAGETALPDKARFYRYAKRSAVETAGGVVLAEKLKIAEPHLTGPAREVLLRVLPMLVGLIRGCARRDEQRPGEEKALVS